MIQNIVSLFQDPLIGKLIWTGLSCVLTGLIIMLIRRLLGLLKVDQEQIDAYRKWTVQIGLLILVLLFVRLWAYEYLQKYLPEHLIQKLVSTAVALLIGIVVILGVRAVVQTLKLGAERTRKYKRWSSYLVFIILIIYLIRVWVEDGLFESEFFSKLITSTVALAFVYTAVFFIRRFINSLKIDIRRRHQYRKRVSYAATFLYILVLIPIWAGSMPQWTTVLSIVGAGVALALHEVLLNMAGWVYIVTKRPYKDAS